ncbi:MAG: hypothetical protein R3A52_14390 [Polyangiales bacterium]
MKHAMALAAVALACRRRRHLRRLRRPPFPAGDRRGGRDGRDVPVVVDVPAVTVSSRWAMAYSGNPLDGATRATLAAEAVSTDIDRAPRRPSCSAAGSPPTT